MKTNYLTVIAACISLTGCNSEKPGETAARDGIRETILLKMPSGAELGDLKFYPEKMESEDRASTKVVAEIRATEDLFVEDVTDTLREPPVIKVAMAKGQSVWSNAKLTAYRNGPENWAWTQDLPDFLLSSRARPRRRFADNAVVAGSAEYKSAKENQRLQNEAQQQKGKEQLKQWRLESLEGLASFEVGMKGQGELEDPDSRISRRYQLEVIGIEDGGADRKVILEFVEMNNRGGLTNNRAKYLVSFHPGLNQLQMNRGEGRIQWDLSGSRVSFMNRVFKITVGRVKTTVIGIKLGRIQ